MVIRVATVPYEDENRLLTVMTRYEIWLKRFNHGHPQGDKFKENREVQSTYKKIKWTPTRRKYSESESRFKKYSLVNI